MSLVIRRIDVASKAINDGRTVEAPPRGLAVVGVVELDVDENYSMLMCKGFYVFVIDGDKGCILK
jgi:hypothetical protein